jgi:hypothetical protein
MTISDAPKMLYPEIESIAGKYGFKFVESVPSSGRSKFNQPFDVYKRPADERHPELELEIISGASVKPFERKLARGEKVNVAVNVDINQLGRNYSKVVEYRDIGSSWYTTVEEAIERIERYGHKHNLQTLL